MTRSRDQRGAATAEAAVVLPLLIAVTLGLVWLLGLAVTQVRAVDAARETARALARGDPDERARAVGATIAPSGTRFEVVAGTDRISVTATCPVDPPGGLFDWIGGFEVSATAVALPEDREGDLRGIG